MSRSEVEYTESKDFMNVVQYISRDMTAGYRRNKGLSFFLTLDRRPLPLRESRPLLCRRLSTHGLFNRRGLYHWRGDKK